MAIWNHRDEDGLPLSASSQVQSNVKQKQLFSVNQFKTWSKCQKKYAYDYVHKLRWPSDQSRFVFGKTLHKLFEYQARSLPFEPILAVAEDEAIRQAWDKVMAHPVPHYPILGSEWAFTVPLGEHWVTGRIDRVSWDPELKQIVILDWKTGTSVPRLPEEDWQTVIYQYAVLESYSQLGWNEAIPKPEQVLPEQIVFSYIEIKDDVREIRVQYSRAKHLETRARIEEALRSMTHTRTFSLPSACPDSFCPYRFHCGIELQNDLNT